MQNYQHLALISKVLFGLKLVSLSVFVFVFFAGEIWADF